MNASRAPAHRTSVAARRTHPDLGFSWRSSWPRYWSTWRTPLLIGIGCTATLRVITTVVALINTYGVDFPHVIARAPSDIVNVWALWDTGYYVTVALHGYPAARLVAGHASVLPKEIAFAPAYPAAMWAVHVVTGANLIVAGQVLSALAMISAVAGIVHLASIDNDRGIAGTSAFLLVGFPSAFFLLADYADSLALFFVVWAFVLARHRHWALVGLFVAGAFFTKYYLLLVAVPLVIEFWESSPQMQLRCHPTYGLAGWDTNGRRSRTSKSAVQIQPTRASLCLSGRGGYQLRYPLPRSCRRAQPRLYRGCCIVDQSMAMLWRSSMCKPNGVDISRFHGTSRGELEGIFFTCDFWILVRQASWSSSTQSP